MTASFDTLVKLYRLVELNPPQNSGRTGWLLIKNQEQLDLLNSILGDEYNYNVIAPQNTVLEINKTVELDFSYPRIGLGIVAYDMEDFLKASKVCFKKPSNYYLISDDYYSAETRSHIPKQLLIYFDVIRFIELLGKAASYFDRSSGRLIFYKNEKLELPIKYSLNDLESLNKDDLRSLSQYFTGNSLHEEEKLTILASSVQDMLSNNYQQKTNEGMFSFILNNMSTLYENFKVGYTLFTSSFSYEKIKSEIDDFKLEEIVKIHKTFSDIQAQVFGIPIATIISATQMKSITHNVGQLTINWLILLGCSVFFILCCFFIYNQITTLKMIKKEANRKKKKIEDDYPSISNYILQVYNELDSKFFWQKVILWSVSIILVCSFLFSIFIFISLLN